MAKGVQNLAALPPGAEEPVGEGESDELAVLCSPERKPADRGEAVRVVPGDELVGLPKVEGTASMQY